MSDPSRTDVSAKIKEASGLIEEAAAAEKCWSCGCFHGSLAAIDRAFSEAKPPPEMEAAIAAGRDRLVPQEYDCLGCEVCYPALAINALGEVMGDRFADVSVCAPAPPPAREGWPPLPGDYTVLRFQAPVAICTLTSDDLHRHLAGRADPAVSIVGAMQTENLGIERLIRNTLANPHIRFLILCGEDSRQEVGHLPGQSLLCLARNGTDDDSRIRGARGKRPFLRNLSGESIDHFRKTLEVIDLLGKTEVDEILRVAAECADRTPGPADPFAPEDVVVPVQGYLPDRTVPDPAGYFVIYADHRRGRLSMEHYRNDGTLDVLIEGKTAPELWVPASEMGLVTRLDHAAYLGRELSRAEEALRNGTPYRQDAAPLRSPPTNPGCCPSCREGPEEAD